jgi:hypothetical protein
MGLPNLGENLAEKWRGEAYGISSVPAERKEE